MCQNHTRSGIYIYAFIVFKGIELPFKKGNFKPQNYEKTDQHKETHAETGSIYTSVLVYKAYYPGKLCKEKE